MLFSKKFDRCLLVAAILLLAACGGGSGNDDNPDTPPPQPVQNTLNITISGNGSVTDMGNSIDCSSDCSTTLDNTVNVSLSATPASGFDFSGWSGACTGMNACDLSLSQDRSVTATFVEQGQVSIISRTANTSCVAPAESSSGSGNYQLQPVFPDLPAISDLVAMFQVPGDTARWYAVSQSGLVQWFENTATASTLTTFVDLRSRVLNSGEQGLLGMAFDPQYATTGRVYFSYVNSDSGRNSIISRITRQGTEPLDISNEEVLLTLSQPASNHNGGGIGFGPDGYLYIGFGDGGGANDTFDHGQNTLSLHSAMLRLDVSGADYTIPSDNPFVGDSNVLNEIYAYGLRNPWRWSFDQQNGELWVADVGQNRIEEVNKVTAGDNLGWPIMEGSECFNANTCNTNGLTFPVTEYDHSGGECSITGGYVYRSSRLSGLLGNFIYGDFCTGRVYRAEPQGGQTYTQEEMLLSGINITGFAQDAQGEVYLLEYNGGAGSAVYRFVETAGGPSNIPENLSNTGCFDSTSQKTYPEFVIPYTVQSQLWSDGADKTRLFAIPDGSSIALESDGDFLFPEQSVIVKNFIRDDRYLETRLFMRHVSGWAGYSYRWLDDESDAVLVTGDNSETITVNGVPHIIPSRGQCFECHTGAANTSLGLEASQLDSEITYPNGNLGNQLDALAEATYLEASPGNNQVTSLVSLDDQSASLELRARSYLHSNCSSCHRPGGSGTELDLRIQTSFADSNSCDVVPNNGNLGIGNARIIAPGESARSVLVARLQSTIANNRMPPLASEVVDMQAVDVVTQWVNALQDCN